MGRPGLRLHPQRPGRRRPGPRRADARGATYEDVWLDLHGGYQGDNFAAALAAAEAFFGAPLDDRLVREAAATVRSPGRLEIVGHDPLVVLDGAKNLEGAERAAAAVARGVRRPDR